MNYNNDWKNSEDDLDYYLYNLYKERGITAATAYCFDTFPPLSSMLCLSLDYVDEFLYNWFEHNVVDSEYLETLLKERQNEQCR
jgi:hypothetical protein